VRLEGRLLHLPPGIRLDLGATAKGLGSDRAVRAAMAANRQAGGVLVSLGGDLAVAGRAPRDGWPILVADEPDPTASTPAQQVRLPSGAIATSSTACRRWQRGGRVLHHIVDPRTGLPADGPWRTATVAAATCADANAAATGAIVAGDFAEEWLASTGMPARLVSHAGEVRYWNGWPKNDGGQVDVPGWSQVYPERRHRRARHAGATPATRLGREAVR
jgi:thiamine biosynthesis lipoprotein